MQFRYAVILAGGTGSRAGGEMPKQFHELLGIPMLWWSVRAFHEADPDTRIILVIHPDFMDVWAAIHAALPEEDHRIQVRLCPGGRSRTESVWNGIKDLPADADTLIAVHDAARPMITADLVTRIWECAEENGSGVPCVDEVNSLRLRTDKGDTEPVDRSRFLMVQTPQTFRADWLHAAYTRRDPDALFTDDASLVQAAGFPVTVCEGTHSNIKVTTPDDFKIAEALL